MDVNPDFAAAHAIMRVSRMVSSTVDRAVRPLGLTFARYQVLFLLARSRGGELRPTKIGDGLMIHQAGVTSLVNQLERDGLVVRRPDPEDGRASLVRITSAGRSLVATANHSVGRLRHGLDLPAAELRVIAETLSRLL